MTERDEQALRDALHELGPDEPVDLGRVRRRAAERRRNARTAAGLAVALVVVAGVVGLPRLMAPGGDQPSSMAGGGQAAPESQVQPDSGDAQPEAGPPGRQVAPSTDPAPDGWRTEYFRDISFAVPATWGYGVPPQSDWCADEPRGELRPDQRKPYVWLGSDIPVRSIGCGGAPPASLLTEHVEALSPGPAVDYVEGAVRQGEWWVVTRFAGSAVLVVTTKDRDRAEQILDSARVVSGAAPCSSQSSIAGPLGARPEDGTDLGRLRSVDQVVLCQYEPVGDPADGELPRLRAAVRLDRTAGQALVDALATAPLNDRRCDPAPVEQRPDLAVLVRIRTGGQTYDVFVNPVGCPGAGMSGGIDDGTTVRVLTRPACSALLVPPVALWAASGAVAENCLR
ncbi:MAG TPA: hypothetical protein VK401_00020 [Propionibacteriaceae bacterium]|nr:hypothetical protein [Propionibacteriaceae bacterium]